MKVVYNNKTKEVKKLRFQIPVINFRLHREIKIKCAAAAAVGGGRDCFHYIIDLRVSPKNEKYHEISQSNRRAIPHRWAMVRLFLFFYQLIKNSLFKNQVHNIPLCVCVCV